LSLDAQQVGTLMCMCSDIKFYQQQASSQLQLKLMSTTQKGEPQQYQMNP